MAENLKNGDFYLCQSDIKELLVRESSKDDYEKIKSLATKVFKARPDSHWAVVGFKRAQKTYVAELRGKILGAVELEIIKLDSKRHGHIGYIFVDPDYQGMGIGKKLIQKAEEYFAKKNCVSVWALTDRENYKARKLFAGLGYKELKKDHVYDILGETAGKILLRRMIYWEGDIILHKPLSYD
ncbi:hypothetical protein DRN52_07405 [Thermococci archaeon]|nr:MAG: hypothetical protein DRN52_07405 [Thermococci archaeon]